jgi:hypothetical protein
MKSAQITLPVAMLLVLGVALAAPRSALSQAIDVGKAQTDMLSRVSRVVDQHASRLGLSRDVVSYCRTELNGHLDSFPSNGSYPFGVNYNQLKTQDQLDLVISLRESYEVTYMRLCLSRAKRDLDVR